MKESNIRSKCRINTNYDEDTFVGVKCVEGDLSINFPLGYRLSETDKELRKDILLLFATLAANTDKQDSNLLKTGDIKDEVQFPMQSCLFIIQDYIARGYYHDLETIYHVSQKGKINWNKTIKTQKPYIQGKEVYYLDFITKSSNLKKNQLITLIHEYCVYDSFKKIGWIFSDMLPKRPQIKMNYRLFVSTIREKLAITFNDRNRQLFFHMLALLDYLGDCESQSSYRYGVWRFEYVWEKMIDKVFGIKDKQRFFPKTFWNIQKMQYENSFLEPDTIMIYDNDIYVLDAKYYKYGITRRIYDLPGSASINKQITYGEFIESQGLFKEQYGLNMKVYNAFLMPYNSRQGSKVMEDIGEAVSNWKDNQKSYQKIKGVLIDIKSLMAIQVGQSSGMISELASIIK